MTLETVTVPERLWKVPDVCAFLGVSPRWVYLHVSLGDLPHTRVGGLLRFWPDAIRNYARGGDVGTANVIPLRRGGA